MGLMQKVLNGAPESVRTEARDVSFLERASRMRSAQLSVDNLLSLSSDNNVSPEVVVQSISREISELPAGRLIGHHVFEILTKMLHIDYAALLLADNSVDTLQIVLHKNLDATTRNKLSLSKNDIDYLTENRQESFLQVTDENLHILKPYFSTIVLDTLHEVCMVPLYAHSESGDRTVRVLGMLILGTHEQTDFISDKFSMVFRSLAPIVSKLLRENRFNNMYIDPVITEHDADSSLTESSADIVLDLLPFMKDIDRLFPHIPPHVFLHDFFQATHMAMHNLGHCVLKAEEQKILLCITHTAVSKQAVKTALGSVWRRLYPEHGINELLTRL